MKFRLLTYNTLFNRAFPHLPAILEKYQPDILCLQEVDTSEKNLQALEKSGYKLADYANCFLEFGKIWGVSTYYNPEKFELVDSKPIKLINGFYEMIKMITSLFRSKGLRRTILKTKLKIKSNSQYLTVYNLHLSAIGLNNLRLKQLKMIDFDEFDQKGSIIITGDFNFPIQRKKLEKIMSRYQLKEATNNLFYTLKYSTNNNLGFLYRFFSKFIRKFWTEEAKLDYIFYRGLQHLLTKRLDYDFSDHFPILADFKI